MSENISAGFIIFRKRKNIEYLLLRRSNDNIWDFPKGRFKEKESELDGAVRELYEETEINKIKIYNFRHELEFINTASIYRKIILFLAQTDQEPKLSKEHKDFIWSNYKKTIHS